MAPVPVRHRMLLAPLSSGLYSLIAIAVLLVGVPLLVVAVLAITSGYIRHDAERFLEEADERDRSNEED